MKTAIIVTVVVTISLLFLWPAPFEFPMDDTYIHFVYAQNLAEQGRLMFNFPSEKGVGSTSLLWVLLLAGGHALGLSMHVLAKALGIASLVTVGVGLSLLLRPIWRPRLALAGPLLVVVVPLVLLLLHPVKDVGSSMAVLMGMGVGATLCRQVAPYSAAGPLGQRTARFAVGLVGVFILYLGLSAVFPGEGQPLYFSLRAVRCALVGLWASLGAPWVFLRLRLASSG